MFKKKVVQAGFNCKIVTLVYIANKVILFTNTDTFFVFIELTNLNVD